ncbi:MAG: tannase/feruloyl esterase family alpha/beta hydrolase [Alphaproteobacteria bacterium]|nr:tannase/feruloyl esterase family alpha/beta hydrolase [Alphaproteobacteria bacterium]
MRKALLGLCGGAAVLAVAAAAFGPARAAEPCDRLRDLALPDVRIAAAEEIAAPVPHCKATGVIGREINFAVWLPDVWNGKFMMGGGGGYVGSVQNQANIQGALLKGYATAGTDTGHTSTGVDASWALGNLERIVNYAHAAVHRVGETAKAVARAHYGKPASRAYFAGCSTGGRQALISAQRYPEDFDAIIAGAPVLDFTGTMAGAINFTKTLYPHPDKAAGPALSPGDRAALKAAILNACDAEDGLADGILNDPRACRFDPKALACSGANRDGCLSAEELAGVRAIYDGPRTSKGRLYYGYPMGGEDEPGGWDRWIVGSKDAVGPGLPSIGYGIAASFMRNFVFRDPNWTYETYDLETFAADTELMAATLNATDTDLSAFRARGGKLLLYHGWSDSALTANATVGYVEGVYARDPKAREDVRLFLLPGVLHCMGGPGPDRVDFIEALERWDETGAAPDTLTASFRAGGGGRTLCAYPQKAAFQGGDPRDPASFVCR